MREVALLIVVGMLGCTRGDDSVGRDPTSAKASASSSNSSTAPVTTSVAPSATTAPTAPTAAELPPIDAACAKDADCGYLWAYLVDGKCCKGTCSPKPASNAHVAEVEVLCKTIGYATENCPLKKCALSGEVACRKGQCVIVKP